LRRNSATYLDSFGWVPTLPLLEFAIGTVRPLPHIGEIKDRLEQLASPDGYFYGGDEEEKAGPVSFLRRIPASHEIRLPDCASDQSAARYGEAGLLAHLLGLLYGYRVQFFDWWVEGRLRSQSETDHSPPGANHASLCVERALAAWRQWPDRQRTVMINALYLHARADVYQQEWERFQAEYQVVDAVYSVARAVGQLPPPPKRRRDHAHKERMATLCTALGLANDSDKLEAIVALRNELLHEALWDGRMPGEARGEVSFRAPYWLHKFSRRALLATLGLRGTYIGSPWWMLGSFQFDAQ
jgi:hypothetical protein